MYRSVFDGDEIKIKNKIEFEWKIIQNNILKSIYILIQSHVAWGLGTLSEFNYTSIFVHFYIDNRIDPFVAAEICIFFPLGRWVFLAQ